MKNTGRLLAIAGLIAAGRALGQTSGCDILIINRGFEEPVLVDNDFSYFMPGWTVIGDSGAFNPAAQTYPGGAVSEGSNCGYVSCCAGGRSQGIMYQSLPALLAANTTYDLSMAVGQRLETPWANLRMQLLAGTTVVIDSLISNAPPRGTFEQRTFRFVCPAGHPALGQRLQIRMTQEGTAEHQANYDAFRLVATPNCVSICTQPESVQTCPGTTVQFTAEHAGIGPFTYQWFRNSVALHNGTRSWGSTISGANARTLSIIDAKPNDGGFYQLMVSNQCGDVNTDEVSLLVCPADFNCDGGVDPFDYLDFITALSTGTSAADRNRDGIVDFFDYLDFVEAYAGGC